MANRIVLNTISYHGKGALENIVPELTGRGYKKAFVCSDPDLLKFGVTQKVTDLLDAAGFAYEIYSDIKANPTIENVQNGVAAFKDVYKRQPLFCPETSAGQSPSPRRPESLSGRWCRTG